MNMKRIILTTASLWALTLQVDAKASISARSQEVKAVKVVSSIFRLEDLKQYLNSFRSFGAATVDLDESIRLLDQTRSELIAALPNLVKEADASGAAANAGFALGLITTDVQTLEAELRAKGKLTPAIQGRFNDVYQLYKELGE